MRDNWRKRNKERIYAVNTVWRRAHLRLVNSYTQAYNARKKLAMPSWAGLKEIEAFYRACPEGHQVDHIIPLRGKTVSGLHVAANLQYLSGVENNKKGNRYAAA
jgi:5-methylcytosine-specific restriction endonuclease McrA